MRVLVTGANGFIGRALCVYLRSKGHELVSVVRSKPQDGQITVGEIGPAVNWNMALHGCDAVVHLAARAHVLRDASVNSLGTYRTVNCDGTLNLARQAASVGVRRFVFISSIGVNGSQKAFPGFTEADEPNPQDPYSISKYDAEMGLREIAKRTGMEVVILRPPLVYGPCAPGNFRILVNVIRKGIPLPLGAVHNQRSFVAVDNLVDFIALCVDRMRSPLAANELFLISDGEDVSTTELLRKVALAYGVKAFLLPIPVMWMRFAARCLGKGAMANRLLGSLVVDSSKARELLGWRPLVSMDGQLKKMALHDSCI